MRVSQLAALTIVVLAIQLVTQVETQSVSVNNQALFTLGLVAVTAGLAYHAGTKSANRRPNNQFGYQQQGGFFPGFFRRRRRQAIPENELDPMVAKLFQVALDQDASNCSLRLTCKIGSISPASLSGHARNLYGTLSKDNQKPSDFSKDQWRGIEAYRVSLNLGRDGGNCDELFPKCQSNSDQLMNVFQKLKISPN